MTTMESNDPMRVIHTADEYAKEYGRDRVYITQPDDMEGMVALLSEMTGIGAEVLARHALTGKDGEIVLVVPLKGEEA
jgi:hypothetical protein